jgi:molybdopterin synthase catalytic subunit
MTGSVALLEIRDTDLSVQECLEAVRSPASGGVALFVGIVRDVDGGRSVDLLEYSAHPTADDVLRSVAESVVTDFPVTAVAATHRTGRLAIGDIAVVVAVSSPHRAEAFTACRAFIDRLKDQVPIWKQQLFSDGSEEWVGSP